MKARHKIWDNDRAAVLGRRALWVALSFLAAAGVWAAEKDVRFDPTPLPTVRAMLRLANVGPGDVVYDLGSGDGRIVIIAAKEFGAQGVGIEIDAKLVVEARDRARQAGVEGRVQFIEADMYTVDLRPASVVTLFLHPDPNLRLRPKIQTELRPGSRVVSYIWDMGDWRPDAEQAVGEGYRKIYLWRVPEPRPRSVKTTDVARGVAEDR